MTISDIVKGLLAMTGKKQTDLSDALGMSSRQSMNNKIRMNRWDASDIIKVAELCGCKVAFVFPDGKQIILEDENKESPDT